MCIHSCKGMSACKSRMCTRIIAAKLTCFPCAPRRVNDPFSSTTHSAPADDPADNA